MKGVGDVAFYFNAFWCLRLISEVQHVIFSYVASLVVIILDVFIGDDGILIFVLTVILQGTQNLILLLLAFLGLRYRQPDQELTEARFAVEDEEGRLRHVRKNLLRDGHLRFFVLIFGWVFILVDIVQFIW